MDKAKRANGIKDLFLADVFQWCEFNSSLIKILFNVSHFISLSRSTRARCLFFVWFVCIYLCIYRFPPLVYWWRLFANCVFFFFVVSLLAANGNCLNLRWLTYFFLYWTHIKIIYTLIYIYKVYIKWNGQKYDINIEQRKQRR